MMFKKEALSQRETSPIKKTCRSSCKWKKKWM